MKNWKRNALWGNTLVLALLLAGCDDGAGEPVPVDSLGRPLSPISAEIVRVNTDADVGMNLLARVEVQPNELVEFYEPRPGLIMVMGAGAPAGQVIGESMAEETKEPASLWARLAGSVPPPAALAAALTRRGSRPTMGTAPKITRAALATSFMPETDVRANEPAHEAAAAEGVRAIAHLTADWCDSTYYSHNQSGYGVLGNCINWHHNVCWDHVTGDGWARNTEAWFFKSNVCPYRGNVTYKVSADESWISQGSWTVLQNTYRWKATTDSGCDTGFDDCPTIRVDILNASGDGYQFRYHVLTVI